MSALTVLYVILPFPIAFILHDAEEIFTQRKWMTSHKEQLAMRFPRIAPLLTHLSRLSTGGFAIAATEELLLILLITASLLCGGKWGLLLWISIFLAFVFHLLSHIMQGIITKGYIPGVVSSIILLPYAFMATREIWEFLAFWEFLSCLFVGISIMIVNLLFAHWLAFKITRR